MISFDERSVVVEVPTVAGLDVGQEFLFQVSGIDACAMFEGEPSKMESTNLTFQIVSCIQARPPYEDARIRTGLEGIGRLGDDRFRDWVEDVSAVGMGLLSERPLDRWQTINVVVKTAYGGAKVEGQVRYCKATQDDEWPYRVGLSAPSMKHSLPLFGIRCGKPREAT